MCANIWGNECLREESTYARGYLRLFTYASSPYPPYIHSRGRYDTKCFPWAGSRQWFAKSRLVLRSLCHTVRDHHIAKSRSSSAANEATKEWISHLGIRN
uniref:Uncharacterized protein n=1 Tax=Parascaris equorum TaxID=6256 RepID=A0A914RZ12_PAREQ